MVTRYSTDEDVLAAIKKWQGDVSQAARVLGIHRNNLYKRLRRLGIDPNALRTAARATPSNTRNLVQPMQPVQPHRGQDVPAHEKAGAIFSGAGGAPHIRRVQTEEATPAPVKEVRARKPVRVRPDHAERLREAKLDLGAHFRLETDETAILEQFFEDAFEGWLKSKLAPQASPPRAKRNGRGGPE